MWRVQSLFWSFAANAIVLAVIVAVFDKVTIGPTGDLLEAAVVFGLLNTIVKPLLKLITLPFAVPLRAHASAGRLRNIVIVALRTAAYSSAS